MYSNVQLRYTQVLSLVMDMSNPFVYFKGMSSSTRVCNGTREIKGGL